MPVFVLGLGLAMSWHIEHRWRNNPSIPRFHEAEYHVVLVENLQI